MFITCKEIPQCALSVFSQERQRVAFRPEVCEARGKKEKGEGGGGGEGNGGGGESQVATKETRKKGHVAPRAEFQPVASLEHPFAFYSSLSPSAADNPRRAPLHDAGFI